MSDINNKSLKIENEIKELKNMLEESALMMIPKKGKYSFDDLTVIFKKQRWIREYNSLKDIFYKLRHAHHRDLKLILILRLTKKDRIERLIKNLSKLNSTRLAREVDLRHEEKYEAWEDERKSKKLGGK